MAEEGAWLSAMDWVGGLMRAVTRLVVMVSYVFKAATTSQERRVMSFWEYRKPTVILSSGNFGQGCCPKKIPQMRDFFLEQLINK